MLLHGRVVVVTGNNIALQGRRHGVRHMTRRGDQSDPIGILLGVGQVIVARGIGQLGNVPIFRQYAQSTVCVRVDGSHGGAPRRSGHNGTGSIVMMTAISIIIALLLLLLLLPQKVTFRLHHLLRRLQPTVPRIHIYNRIGQLDGTIGRQGSQFGYHGGIAIVLE